MVLPTLVLIWLFLILVPANIDYRHATGENVDAVELLYGLVVLIINTISLAFDTIDSIKWWHGERKIVGFPDADPVI